MFIEWILTRKHTLAECQLAIFISKVLSITTVEEHSFKDREGSLVVCHRIISMKRDEGRKEEKGRIQST